MSDSSAGDAQLELLGGNPLDSMVGGNHYREGTIQPIQFIQANNLGFIEGSIVKYATRHERKNGREDVLKIIHYAQLLLELKYGGQ